MKRLFNNDLIESDSFLDLPFPQQILYIHLCLNADDEGFIKNPKTVCRMTGINYSECEELIQKGYFISFTNGVIVVTHWFYHNTIRKDRMKMTVFRDEKSYLVKGENGIYNVIKNEGDNQLTTNCQPIVHPIYIINTIYNIISNNNININGNTNCCTELSNSSEQEIKNENTFVINLPLNDGTEHIVTTEDYERYVSLYPDVDIMQQLRNMKGWFDGYPKKKKTSKGINRFINNWLRKEQDKFITPIAKGEKTNCKSQMIDNWTED